MDERLLKVLEQKVQDATSQSGQVGRLAGLLADGQESFVFGVLVGRIYNSFYYQSKRILGREPTDAEFEEFLDFIRKNRSKIGSR
ncbi:MAG: hypothetical protein EB829_00510 [Nitrosopumilus sp. H8]|nr:MAG: hypothetical protein EB829_00510 [Nitrosopumilus sp. H8]